MVDIRRTWPEVLAKVQARRRTTQALLASATVVGLEAGVLRLSTPSPALARRILEPANADVLRAGLKEVLGVDYLIRCEADSGGARSSGRPPAQDRRSAPPADAWDDAPPPEPPAEAPDEDIPDDYGDPPNSASASSAARDPEAMAIELLSTQLGARPLDPQT